ncbi:MAG: hypothetical protein U1E05_27510, partial [Patescibacteria group bacterium]|nr:hypothetical protein [Patescibacteria group bacterium]
LEATLAQLGGKDAKENGKDAATAAKVAAVNAATVKQASHQTAQLPVELEAMPELIPPGMIVERPPMDLDHHLPDAMPMELDPNGGPLGGPLGGPVGGPLGGPDSWPSWMPACCANLGMAYLENDKPEQAAILYDFAAHLFRMRGDHVASQRAQRISDDLQAVLRQYAPYKPPPLSRRLPPGKF